MKSTKVQNPRCIQRIQANNARLLATHCGAAVLPWSVPCIVWGKAEPAIRPSRTILHDALNGQNCNSVRGFRRSCTVCIYNDRRGGWVTKLYACALFIIDGLGHATCPRRCRFLDPERRFFSENATFFERLLR